jgi:predicted metal-dependent phosphoesterase TrpH
MLTTISPRLHPADATLRVVPTRSRPPRRPLLCELHAHSAWSDGELGLAELAELYGARGFDVLAVTDHVVRAGDPTRAVGERAFAAYAEAIGGVAKRALRDHGLLVIPGLELTYSGEDPDAAVHAVAVGLHRYVGVDAGPRAAMADARAAGAAIIAAHPHSDEPDPRPARTPRRI